MRDKERQSASGGGAERKGDTEPEAGSRLWAVNTEPGVGLKPMNCEIMTWAKVGRLTDWAIQTPFVFCSFHILFYSCFVDTIVSFSSLNMLIKFKFFHMFPAFSGVPLSSFSPTDYTWFKKIIILFIFEKREREHRGGAEIPKWAPHWQSPTWASNSQTARSRPELKLDAQPTGPPRCPYTWLFLMLKTLKFLMILHGWFKFNKEGLGGYFGFNLL